MDRHVAVTGASSGLGEAIARAFGAAGDRLTLVARRAGLLEAVASAVSRAARVPSRTTSRPPTRRPGFPRPKPPSARWTFSSTPLAAR